MLKYLKFIEKIKVSQQFIIFLILVIAASLYFCFVYLEKFDHMIDTDNNMIFFKIPFGNGPLISNLLEGNGYARKFYNDISFSLEKLPFLPILLFLIAKFLTTNFYLIIIIKNLLTFSILYWVIIFYLKSFKLNINYLYVFLLVFLIPYNMYIALTFEFAESIMTILFPCLFLILVSNNNQKYLLSTLIIFILYLSKTSMFFVSIIIPFIIIFFEREKKFKKKKYFIFFGPILAMIIWATFSYLKTDRVAIGTNTLTINSLGLTIASDKRFFNYYPNKSVDILLYKIEIPKNLKTEWEVSDYFKNKNSAYFLNKDNLKDYLMTIPKKIMIILFYVRKDSVYPDADGNINNPVRYSHIPNKIFINLSILIALYSIISYAKKGLSFKNDFIFISLLGLSLLPLIAGWATSKHIIPITVLCFFYIVIKIQVYKKIIT